MSQDNSESFAELFQASSPKKHQRLNPGEKITAQVVALTKESVFLDVGGKSEGVVDRGELDQEQPLAVGDQLEVYFLRATGSELIFTTKLGGSNAAGQLEEAWRAGIPVEGVVKKEIKGGFEVMVSGSVRGFCPYSQLALRRVENPAETFLDQTLTFLITRFEQNGRNLVVSARAIQEREREEQKEALKETLSEGMTVDGSISSVRDFGLFVDIGGVDGLVPLSELGWSRVEDIHQDFTAGDQVRVVVKSLDWERDRIGLSIKETLADPWDQVLTDFPVGCTVSGTVARLTSFGAFVSLSPGIDGLVHISKLGRGRRINHPREAVEEGQALEVQVDEIDLEKRNIRLSPTDLAGQATDQDSQTEEQPPRKPDQAPRRPSPPKSLGTLGDLLAKSLKEKKK